MGEHTRCKRCKTLHELTIYDASMYMCMRNECGVYMFMRHDARTYSCCSLRISRFGRGLRFSSFVPSSVHGSRSGHELGTDDVGGHAEFKSVFQSAYALLQEACKTFGLLAQRRTLVPTMGCNGFVMVSGQAALRTLAPLVPHVLEASQERANMHRKSAAACNSEHLPCVRRVRSQVPVHAAVHPGSTNRCG